MDPEGKERWRLEGYLPKDEFRAHLEMGLARVAFMRKEWEEAERRFADILARYPDSPYAPEAVYYKGVSRYSGSHDGTVLADTATELVERFRGSEWQQRSIPWLAERSESTAG